MEALARRFIEERAKRGAQGRGRRVPEDLRRLAVRFATRFMEQGGSRGSAARRLCINERTLERWIIGHGAVQEAAPEFREVVVREVAPESTPANVSLVTPDGFRVEGVDLREVPRLLSSLR